MSLTTQPHRRWNPLLQEWVLVSPHRTDRPWQGQMETPAAPAALTYDPKCYLCPGNLRAGGHQTPVYTDTYVFENDFAALKMDVAPESRDEDGLLVAESEPGLCRVICFSPRHDLTLAKMDIPAIRKVVDVWAAQVEELEGRPEIHYVQIFENRGAMMGASNPHPHGQIWATHALPNEITAELKGQRDYLQSHGTSLLPAYLALELAAGRTGCGGEPALRSSGAVLGCLAIRDSGSAARAGCPAHGSIGRRTVWAGGHSEAAHRRLRCGFRCLVPVLDGHPWRASGWSAPSGVADASSLLSAAAALRYGAEVHGGL